MASAEAQMMTADALRILVQDIDKQINRIRRLIRKGYDVTAEVDSYRRDLRWANCLREQGEVQGCTGPLFQPELPKPIYDGFVGFTPSEKFKREWRLDPRLFPVAVPHHYSIAAE